MGIVFKQSARNTVLTFIGFGLGAINTLFLYVKFLSEQYYGLVGVILSTATLLAPLLAFGVPNTLVKYFPRMEQAQKQQQFLKFMLFLPLVLIIPLGIISWLLNEGIAAFLAGNNEIVADYLWHIFFIGLFMAYFEVFFAMAKVQLQSVFGTFLKEIAVRLGVFSGLVALAFEQITVTQFLLLLVILYGIRMILMGWAAFRKISFKWTPGMVQESREIMGYAALIILGGSIAVLLMEVDRFMINQFIQIENVAYYTVAVFVVTVISIPLRSMHQITYPLTAKYMADQAWDSLKELYKKSSLTLLSSSILLALLILLNLDAFYQLIPDNYRGGAEVVLLLSLVKIYDAFLGINSSILYNSKYFKALLILGIFLALATVLLNIWLIPSYGIWGAALATFIAVFFYNTAKLIFVYKKFKLLPGSGPTLKIVLLGVFTAVLFYPLNFSMHPILSILLTSLLVCLFYLGLIYRFNWSEDITNGLNKWLKR